MFKHQPWIVVAWNLGEPILVQPCFASWAVTSAQSLSENQEIIDVTQNHLEELRRLAGVFSNLEQWFRKPSLEVQPVSTIF